jgi:hypothetical protein
MRTHIARAAATKPEKTAAINCVNAPGHSARLATSGRAQPRCSRDHQRACEAAANRALDQSDVNGVELQPDKREQKSVGDETDSRGERVPGDNREGRQCQDQDRHTGVKRFNHDRRPRRAR